MTDTDKSRRRRWIVPALVLGVGAWVAVRRRAGGSAVEAPRTRTTPAAAAPARRSSTTASPAVPGSPAQPSTGPAGSARAATRPAATPAPDHAAPVEPVPGDPPQPAVAEPAVAEPAVAEPAVAEPAVAEPAVAEPAVAEPADAPATRRPSPVPRRAPEPTSSVRPLLAVPTDTPPESSHGPGSALPLPDGSAPGPEFTIKGNAGSMLFHPPSSPYYGRTRAEVWFRTAEDATAAGFTAYTPRRRTPR